MREKLTTYGVMLLAALVTGTLLCLALPLGEQSYLAWMMLIPLLLATREKGFLVGFLGGLTAVFWCAFLAMTGVFYSIKFTFASPAWTFTACGIFGASFSLFFGIYGDKENYKWPWYWLTALSVVLEAALLFQIPAHLALTQYRNWVMMLVASVGGIWLVSALIWLCNVVIAQDLRKRYWIGLVVIALSFITSRFQPFAVPVTEGLTVGAVQVKDGLDEDLVAAHQKASLQKPDFLVWPEFAGMLFVFQNDTKRLKEISANAAPLITSFRDVDQPLPHNVAALFSKGVEYGRYEKRKLFGKEVEMHKPGTKAFATAIPGKSGNVALNICYDSCFPYIIRESANQPDVKIVALPTIDPDSMHYFMAAMHSAYTPFRAAENGVAMVRADGYYGSMIVNERGAIVEELSIEQTSMVGKVSGNRPVTVVRYLGDWFLYVCLVVTSLPSVLWLRSKLQKKDPR